VEGQDDGKKKADDGEGDGKGSYNFTGSDVADPKYRPLVNDIVQFNLMLDKPTQRKYATGITLVERKEDPARVAALAEPREQGVVCTVKDAFGFIKCCDREDRIFYHFTEVEDGRPTRNGDEVEFNILTQGKASAIAITLLPRGTVTFESIIDQKVSAVVEKELRGVGNVQSRDRRGERPQRSVGTGGLVAVTREGGEVERLAFCFSRRRLPPPLAPPLVPAHSGVPEI